MIDLGALQSGTLDVGPLQSTVVIGVAVAPSNGSVLLTGYAPSISFGIVASPGQGSLLFTGHASTVVIGIKVSPGQGALLLTGHAPSGIIIGVIVAPGEGSLLLTGHDPTGVIIGATVSPDPGAILSLGYAPVVSIYSTAVDSDTGTLQVTGYAPSSIAVWNGLFATPATGSIKLTGHISSAALWEPIVYPDTGTLQVTGFVPTIVLWHVMNLHPSLIPFGSLKITGHAPKTKEFGKGLVMYIDGVDQTKYVVINGTGVGTKAQQFQLQCQTLGRWTATFDLYDQTDTFQPQLNHTVRITDYGVEIFSGVLHTIIVERLQSTVQCIVYHCTALDRSSMCDRRLVKGKVYSATEFPDVRNVVDDIVANSLDGEGITIDKEYPSVPLTMGAMKADFTFNYQTVTSSFDQIATFAGCVWWIDSASVLWFQPFDALPAAPFTLTETSKNWRNLSVTTTTANYYNRMWAVGSRYVGPDGASGSSSGLTETFTLDGDATTMERDPLGNLYYCTIATSQPIGTITSMTVDGHDQTVYDFSTATTFPSSTGPYDYVWVFGTGETILQWAFTPNPPPPEGKTVIINYNIYSATGMGGTTAGLTSVSLAQTKPPLTGSLGSGIFDGAVQVDDYITMDDLNAAAKAELDRIDGLPYTLDFETDWPGLRPGQLLTVDIPLSDITTADPILITNVSGLFYPLDIAAAGKAPHSGSFRWTVQGISSLDPGGLFIKYFERIIHRSQNSLPLPDYEEATFILGPGGNLSSGTSITNPYICGRSGALFEWLFAASEPTATASLTMQVTINGGDLIRVVMLPGLSPNTLVTKQVSPNLVIHRGDVLNVNTSYDMTGDPASGVTLKLRWQTPSSNT